LIATERRSSDFLIGRGQFGALFSKAQRPGPATQKKDKTIEDSSITAVEQKFLGA
jgi:hypothetical protein